MYDKHILAHILKNYTSSKYLFTAVFTCNSKKLYTA